MLRYGIQAMRTPVRRSVSTTSASRALPHPGSRATIPSCPAQAITQDGNAAPAIDHDKCIDCGLCARACNVFEHKPDPAA